MACSAALVTGGAKRIGAAICLHLGQKGHSVAVHHNSSSNAAEALAASIREMGVDACTVKGDLSKPEDVAKIISDASSQIGPISHLVNNASKFQFDDIQSFDSESWNSHMDVNAKAPLMLTRILLQNLPEGSVGSAVNILDQQIAAPNPDYLSYTASRYALLGITEALARGLAPKLRVNAVAPTFVVTSMTKKFLKNKKFKKETLNNIPLGRFAEMSEIASTVVFLASDAASMIHGTSILVDGGWTAK